MTEVGFNCHCVLLLLSREGDMTEVGFNCHCVLLLLAEFCSVRTCSPQ